MKTEQIIQLLQDRDVDRVLSTGAFTGMSCYLCGSAAQINHVAHFYHRSERIIPGNWRKVSSFTSVAFQNGPESLNRIEGICPACEKVLRKGIIT